MAHPFIGTTGAGRQTGEVTYVVRSRPCQTNCTSQHGEVEFLADAPQGSEPSNESVGEATYRAVNELTSPSGQPADPVRGVDVLLAEQQEDIDVVGINVYDTDHERIERRIGRLLDETLKRSKLTPNAATRLRIVHDFLGEDYGIPTRQTVDAIRTLAATEGIVTDPVYSGKALGGLLEMIRRRDLGACDNAIFVHTGGAASLPECMQVRLQRPEPDQRYE